MDDPKLDVRDKEFAAKAIVRFARWFESKMPTRASMAKNKYLKPIAHRFLLSDLWRFNRRSVPRGVALGMLAGFIVPFGGQTFVALFLALPIRANVPISAVTTFITNPFTYPFWFAIANQIGKFVLRIDEITVDSGLEHKMDSGVGEWMRWLGMEVGVTFLGFVVLGVVFGSVGYLISSFGWRWWIARKRKARLRKMGNVIILDEPK